MAGGTAGGDRGGLPAAGRTPIGYRELVERCHGVRARLIEESQFEQAHELLAAALPGTDSLRERYAAWESAQLLSGERLVAGLGALARELRARCHSLWELPDGERVVFEPVRGEHWLASAGYQGGLCTLVKVNDQASVPAWRLVEIVAHEAYPGHHSETVCKETALVSAGRSELNVYVYTTPQATMAEGLAMLAPEVLLGDEIDEVAVSCLRPLGIDYDTRAAGAVRAAMELLLPLRANLALMRDEGRIDEAGMRAYARRWLLGDDGSVEREVSSLCARQWPPVESCYPEGLRLSRRFVSGDPRRFGRLLREQLTPRTLAT